MPVKMLLTVGPANFTTAKMTSPIPAESRQYPTAVGFVRSHTMRANSLRMTRFLGQTWTTFRRKNDAPKLVVSIVARFGNCKNARYVGVGVAEHLAVGVLGQ